MKKIPNTPNVSAPVVILVRPQLSENMGMCARAMMNCGLAALRIVSPREPHTSDKAISAAAGAGEILNQATAFNTLDEAISDMHFVLATTARTRDMVKPIYYPETAQSELLKRIKKGQKCAVLFGPERTGLENSDLAMADGFITIPLNPKHTSLNLSQAVLLIGYEWYKGFTKQKKWLETNGAKVAEKGEVDRFLTHLEGELAAHGYFRWPDKEGRMKRNLRDIFTRVSLTDAEIRTLYGALNDLVGKG